MENQSQLEQQVDDMFDRLDARYFEMMRTVIDTIANYSDKEYNESRIAHSNPNADSRGVSLLD